MFLFFAILKEIRLSLNRRKISFIVRRSHGRCSIKIGVLKNFESWSLFLITLQAFKNICEQLLLYSETNLSFGTSRIFLSHLQLIASSRIFEISCSCSLFSNIKYFKRFLILFTLQSSKFCLSNSSRTFSFCINTFCSSWRLRNLLSKEKIRCFCALCVSFCCFRFTLHFCNSSRRNACILIFSCCMFSHSTTKSSKL